MQDNNLVMALLGAGIVFVLVIVVYNQWQIRKARRPEVYNPPAGEAPQGEGWADRHEPALGGQRDEIGRVEPRLEPGLAPRSDASATGSAETEAGVIGAELTPGGEEAEILAAAMEEPVEESVPGALEPATGVIDPLIDCIVPLHPEREVSGDRLLPALAKLRRAGTKQIHVEGLNPAANAWETIRAGQRYLDRGGPQRDEAHVDEGHPWARPADRGDTDDGPVLGALTELLEAGRNPFTARDRDLDEHLVRPDRGLPEVEEELRDRDVAAPAWSFDGHGGVESEQRRGQIGRRIGVDDRAGDGAAAAHLRVADRRGGFRE